MKRITENLRHQVFWTLDWLKGGTLRAHYKDIANIMENFNSHKSQTRRKDLLQKILNHATETTDFYSKFKGYKDLENFPVIDKSVMRDNFNAFQSSTFINKPNKIISTSGSSGAPFKTYQNNEKVLRNRADTIYFQQKAGYKIGYRLYYIRRWLPRYRISSFNCKMRNIEMGDVADFSDSYFEQLIETLSNDTSTKVILSYSSALRDLCQYLDRIQAKPSTVKLSSIIAMAEALDDNTRSKLEYYFDAPIYLRYSNHENGILSLQLSQTNQNLQINWASYFIEILHLEKDVPVSEGELGRVVVTDLFNYCMPFIRYDTGDMATASKKDAFFNGSQVFSRVEGRMMDALLNTKGDVISGFNILILDSFKNIRQYQVIQDGRLTYCINLVVAGALKDEKKIVEHFKSFLGADAQIKIKHVAEIALLASGKRRLIVNNYQKKEFKKAKS
ncbi:MAG: phenylacetate--CoA ligase family protein [Pricia sp.]|nr:phenylacetate--CoA ligase family protein [Pricia sp.]